MSSKVMKVLLIKEQMKYCTLSNKKCPFSDTFCLGENLKPLLVKGFVYGMVVEKYVLHSKRDLKYKAKLVISA
jgi:hypothetical protein